MNIKGKERGEQNRLTKSILTKEILSLMLKGVINRWIVLRREIEKEKRRGEKRIILTI